jgi:hypothetical protein
MSIKSVGYRKLFPRSFNRFDRSRNKHREIPSSIEEELLEYLEHRQRPSSCFVRFVLCNDLRSAVTNGDRVELACLELLVKFLVDHAPRASWGSVKSFEFWVKKSGGFHV